MHLLWETFKWYYTIRENLEKVRMLSVYQIPNDASLAFMEFSDITNKNELQTRRRYCDKYNIIAEDENI